MSEFDEIQRLIRLKRHESPPEDFVDDFVRSFQQRQRSEMLNQSARGLLWERMATYFHGLMSPKVAWATAAVAVIAGSAVMMRQGEPSVQGVPAVVTTVPNAIEPISQHEVDQYLLKRHYRGGLADEARDVNVNRADANKVFPVGFRVDVQQ